MHTTQSGIHHFKLDDHLVLLADRSDRIQILDPLARFIWESIDQGIAKTSIAEDISSVYNIPHSQALQDIETTLANIHSEFETYIGKSNVNTNLPTHSLEASVEASCSATERCYQFPRFSFRIRCEYPEITLPLEELLNIPRNPDAITPDHEISIELFNDEFAIYVDKKKVETANSYEYAAVMAFRAITELACRRENWLTILHAAGVTYKNKAIIFPALGGSGKTTLATALVSRGFNYINDDVIPLERGTGNLIPIPMSPCVKSGSWRALKAYYPEIDSLKAYGRNSQSVKYIPVPATRFVEGTPDAKYLFIPNYQTKADTTCQEISSAMALSAIVEGESLLSLPLAKNDIEELLAWVSKLTCYTLSYSNLEEAVEAVKSRTA